MTPQEENDKRQILAILTNHDLTVKQKKKAILAILKGEDVCVQMDLSFSRKIPMSLPDLEKLASS
jgi:hypothetical protein